MKKLDLALHFGAPMPWRGLRRYWAAACLMAGSAAWAYDSGSTGADGAFNPAVDTVVQLPPSGVFNFTSVNIPAGVTVRFKRNALNTPVIFLVQGNVTIAGTIDVSGGNGTRTALPGVAGPGGFDGGRGGQADSQGRAAVWQGGAGQGPGGGEGGRPDGTAYQVTVRQVSDNSVYTTLTCMDNRVVGYVNLGLGAGHASRGPDARFDSKSTWGATVYGTCNGSTPAALAYGSTDLQPLIGGSGGGGGRGNSTYPGAGGGGGGGAILVAASGSITVTGQVKANAGHGGYPDGGAGAGGSGGAIRLIATNVVGGGALEAKGGCAQEGNDCNVYYAPGSLGRIRVEAETFSYTGTSNPWFMPGSPSATIVAASPSLTITSVAGTVVSPTPSGIDDVVLPATLTNPVIVALRTSNVPLGSTVQIRVVPAQGLPVLATSTALSGTLSDATATASVSLPQGPSRLEANVTFNVTVAMGQALAVYANNETVRQVEILSGGTNSGRELVLVTESGRRHTVPAAWLYGVSLGG